MKKRKKDETENETKKGIAESFLGGVPLFGDFFKELAKTEVFQEKFKEVNEEIEENLRKGQERKWNVEGHLSIRPLSMRPIAREIKKDTSEMFIGKDYFYGKKDNKLTLAVKVPKEDVELSVKGKNLFITAEDFEKKLELPDYYRNIKKKEYKKGILVLELQK